MCAIFLSKIGRKKASTNRKERCLTKRKVKGTLE